ncbi:hypothetical protein [Phytoactinopolyspora limicola]|uniref:hypothetical protein n=1 Tax=Phytoactinopolyspora limicola TaxID=2715536 RepID=UPI00140A0198|nr:hypothetical protein [Phytoactinopolyspora limicola]
MRHPGDIDLAPEWATEAALDEERLVLAPDPSSKSGTSIRIVGYSPSANRILVVILVPKDIDALEDGEYWGGGDGLGGRLANDEALLRGRRPDMTDSIKKILADEADQAEANATVDDALYVRNRHKAKDPSQVYSLRIPVHRLEELRAVAQKSHLAPSVLMRRWVLERLDEERDGDRRSRNAGLEPDSPGMIVMTEEEFAEQVGSIASRVIDRIVEPLLQQRLEEMEQRRAF